jgi:hypothetical protein
MDDPKKLRYSKGNFDGIKKKNLRPIKSMVLTFNTNNKKPLQLEVPNAWGLFSHSRCKIANFSSKNSLKPMTSIPRSKSSSVFEFVFPLSKTSSQYPSIFKTVHNKKPIGYQRLFTSA